jgi:hypothetical protein
MPSGLQPDLAQRMLSVSWTPLQIWSVLLHSGAFVNCRNCNGQIAISEIDIFTQFSLYLDLENLEMGVHILSQAGFGAGTQSGKEKPQKGWRTDAPKLAAAATAAAAEANTTYTAVVATRRAYQT